MTDPRAEKIIALSTSLRGFEQYMTLLLELDAELLESLVSVLENQVFDHGHKNFAKFYSWVRFVRDMRSMNYLSELSWADQRPENLKMD